MCGIQSISSRVSCSTLPMWHSQSRTAIEFPLPSLTGSRGRQVGMLRRWVITTPFAPFCRCPHQPGHAEGVWASHCWGCTEGGGESVEVCEATLILFWHLCLLWWTDFERHFRFSFERCNLQEHVRRDPRDQRKVLNAGLTVDCPGLRHLRKVLVARSWACHLCTSTSLYICLGEQSFKDADVLSEKN